MSRIAVLGLGSMGSRMAANFAQAGHDVVVWNRNPARSAELADAEGAEQAASPREAAAGADFIVSMVADDEAASFVWLDPDHGAFASVESSAIAIESSTLSPVMVTKLGVAAKEHGVAFVEAPVVGSRPQVEAGALFALLGGDSSVIDRVMPVIEVNCAKSKAVGAVGNAAVMKLAINGLFAAQVAAYGEVVGFLERSALDSEEAVQLLANLPITSPGLQRILGLISERQYEPNFPVHLVAKDLAYLGAAAGDVGADVPLMTAAAAVFAEGAQGPTADLDIAGIASLYENS